MAARYWVRIGVLGSVGRFLAADGYRYARGMRVVCRTPRGLEVGEVLAPSDPIAADNHAVDGDAPPTDGTLLRRVTVEDDLLLARLEKNRHEALVACSDRLAELAIPAVLVDVEHLFDGQTLLFYFLGETTPQIDAVTAELAEVYEAQVQFRQFTETLTAGCGPHCGTEEAEGCGSGACSVCAVASACGGTKGRGTEG